MDNMTELKLLGLSEVMGVEDVILLSLVDKAKQRQLIVTCDRSLRKSFLMFMQHKPEANTLLPKVMANIFSAEGLDDLSIVIKGVHDGEYETEIIDAQSNKFPIRCSDALLLSLASDKPIFATSEVMMGNSMPYQEGAAKIGLPLTVLSEDMLQLSLEKAIQDENYEMASNLRDELKKRHSKGEQV